MLQLHDMRKQGKCDIAEQQQEEGVQDSTRGEHNTGENLEHWEGEDGHEEEDEEPSALEKILPQFPAARKEVFVRVEAVLGLLPPFTARDRDASARVFWGGQEVRKRIKKSARKPRYQPRSWS